MVELLLSQLVQAVREDGELLQGQPDPRRAAQSQSSGAECLRGGRALVGHLVLRHGSIACTRQKGVLLRGEHRTADLGDLLGRYQSAPAAAVS